MLVAASEEVVDNTVFEFQVSLSAGRTYEGLAEAVLKKGADAPVLQVMVRK